MLTRLELFSEAELMSRFHVRVERYIKNLLIEVDTLRQMIDTSILPACFAYHGTLVQTVAFAKQIGTDAPEQDMMSKVGKLISALKLKREELENVYRKVETISSEEEKAKYLSREVSVAMLDARTICDELEAVVSDDFWPLPKYREMLFMA